MAIKLTKYEPASKILETPMWSNVYVQKYDFIMDHCGVHNESQQGDGYKHGVRSLISTGGVRIQVKETCEEIQELLERAGM